MIFYLNFLKEDAIYKNIQEPYCITIDIGYGREKGFLGDPYAKIYKGTDPKRSPEDIRLSLLSAKIVKHTDGKDVLYVNKDIKKWILKTLYKTTTNKKYKPMNVYDAMWAFIYDVADDFDLPRAEKVDMEEFIINLKRS